MCILQRYAFITIAIFALIASVHNPNQKLVKNCYSLVISSLALVGSTISIRHLYLENNPPEIFDCGADLGYMLDAFPVTQVFPLIFKGTGDCSEIPWSFLGLSFAGWALLWFILFFVLATLVIFFENTED
mgnify:CR=1 FL=1